MKSIGTTLNNGLTICRQDDPVSIFIIIIIIIMSEYF